MIRRWMLLLVGAVLLAGGAVAHEMEAVADTAPVAATKVAIDNFSFVPQTIKVPVGATVTWTNQDDIPHLVKATDGGFKSPALDTGDTYQFKFDKKGEYRYFCALHPKMTGRVVVE